MGKILNFWTNFSSGMERGCKWFVATRFGKKFSNILYDTGVLIFYIGAIALLHKIIDLLLGENALLLGFVPIGYIIDLGHILAIGLFFLEIVKEIVQTVKGIIWTKEPITEQEL